MLQAIIVDDEELSVKRLKRILSESRKVEVCHTFLNPLEAYEFVKTNPVDIAFLDISMPQINGMKLSALLLELDESMEVVFVTGYDEYAVQAFDMSALDYLLKPVTEERVSKTLNKFRRRYRQPAVESSVRVHLFNGLKIYRHNQDDAAITLRSPKTEELFAFLICKGTVTREETADTLWRDLKLENRLKNLNSTLYYIRKAISAGKSDDCIIAGKNEIRIDENNIYCDLYEFEQLLKQIRRTPAQSADLFKQAEALYTGDFLKGKAYEWAIDRTRRLEQSYIELLETAAKFHLEQSRQEQSLHYFCEILKLDPLREDISYEVIRLYAELGRKNEALRQYRLLEEGLQQELGTKPDPRTAQFVLSFMHELKED